MARKQVNILQRHPCFSRQAHGKYGRVHLPVAPACNVQCAYCLRKYDCANESRPGVTSVVLGPQDALDRVRDLVERDPRLAVIGIAGPGDPLANDATFETLKAMHREFPHLILCVSTNGLALTDRLDELVRNGVSSVTITINAVSPAVASQIYRWAYFQGRHMTAHDAASLILANQWRGLQNAIDAGLLVKINSVIIPGVNDAELPMIAEKAGSLGADIQNLIPLYPQADLAHVARPSREYVAALRLECGMHMPQMSHCRQCRADACGTLDENKDVESEVLAARLGDTYEMTH